MSKVADLIEKLKDLPQDSEVVFIVGTGRKHLAANLGEIEVRHRLRGSNILVEESSEDTEPVVGLRW